MCGIAGWISFEQDLSNEFKIIEAMTNTLSARGPDASGTWFSKNAALGHRRLCVVDPVGGTQPMVWQMGERTYILIYNGELYNTDELRRQLISLGYSFRSNSDTEVLLVSYIEWGNKCLDLLNGIFAFGVWSEHDKTLFLARDRFGVKPLFYSIVGNSLVFGSELKALLVHPYIKAEIDMEGLSEIFALGPARTPGHGIFKDVNELKASHSMIYNMDGCKINKYWKLESNPHEDNLGNTISKVGDLVKDTIIRQLVSDVPLCTFLSGGLDSSIITAIAANQYNETGMGQLHTFSIDYVDNDKHFKPSIFQPNSDAPWVKRMAEAFDTYHHYINVDTPQLSAALIDAMQARDLPGMVDIDSSLLLFCKEVKKYSTVALSGECHIL